MKKKMTLLVAAVRTLPAVARTCAASSFGTFVSRGTAASSELTISS